MYPYIGLHNSTPPDDRTSQAHLFGSNMNGNEAFTFKLPPSATHIGTGSSSRRSSAGTGNGGHGRASSGHAEMSAREVESAEAEAKRRKVQVSLVQTRNR